MLGAAFAAAFSLCFFFFFEPPALLPAPGGVQAALRVPFATALAVSDVSLGVLPDQDVRLKWPNDIRVRGAKLCGILVEAGQTNGAYWLAIGIGLNVRSAPEGTGQTVTCLLQEGAGPELQAEDLMELFFVPGTAHAVLPRADFIGRNEFRMTGILNRFGFRLCIHSMYFYQLFPGSVKTV